MSVSHIILTVCDITVFLIFRQDVVIFSEQSQKASTGKRSKRLARSRIPSKPVEMPGGVDSLDLEV